MEPSIKGQNISLAKEYLEKTYGPDAVNKVLAVLSVDDRAILSKRIYTGFWEPEKSFVHLLDAADKVLGKGDYGVCFQCGHYSARQAIPKFFKIFIRFGDPLFVIKRGAAMWGQEHNHGRFEVSAQSDHSAVFRLHEYKTPSPAFCAGLRGYCVAVLEMCGAKNVSIVEKQCTCNGASYCEFEAAWE